MKMWKIKQSLRVNASLACVKTFSSDSVSSSSQLFEWFLRQLWPNLRKDPIKRLCTKTFYTKQIPLKKSLPMTCSLLIQTHYVLISARLMLPTIDCLYFTQIFIYNFRPLIVRFPIFLCSTNSRHHPAILICFNKLFAYKNHWFTNFTDVT